MIRFLRHRFDEAFSAFEELSKFLGERIEESEEETPKHWSCPSLSYPYEPGTVIPCRHLVLADTLSLGVSMPLFQMRKPRLKDQMITQAK